MSSDIRQPLPASSGIGEGVEIALLRVLLQVRLRDGADPAHAGYYAPEPVQNFLLRDMTDTEVLMQNRQKAIGRSLNGTQRRRERGLTQNIQRTPTAAQIGKLRKGLPFQPLLHSPGEFAAGL